MNDLEKVLKSAKSISSEIRYLLKESTYKDYDDMSGLKIDYNNADQLFLLDELKGVLELLEDAKFKIDYLSSPITHVGTLYLNSRGRYETQHREYTCGSGIEILVYDDWKEKECWVKTSVEHADKDYYIVGYRDIPMQGLKVRVR